ncbi:hypothetical protein L9F63_021190, partial [Diploptera punctata]
MTPLVCSCSRITLETLRLLSHTIKHYFLQFPVTAEEVSGTWLLLFDILQHVNTRLHSNIFCRSDDAFPLLIAYNYENNFYQMMAHQTEMCNAFIQSSIAHSVCRLMILGSSAIRFTMP